MILTFWHNNIYEKMPTLLEKLYLATFYNSNDFLLNEQIISNNVLQIQKFTTIKMYLMEYFLSTVATIYSYLFKLIQCFLISYT